MFKNVQIKIILIIIILAFVMVSFTGWFFINELETIKTFITEKEIIEVQILKGKVLTLSILTSLILISIVVIIFSIKMITIPINRLIKVAKKIAEGEEAEEKLIKNTKNNTEIDELTKAFKLMITNLKQNLNEVNRQKKQIETILLHMTDGIVAFNIDGNIIHINPAAINLLQITSKENTFEKIFKKLKININMEKIIYLEDLTSTELKFYVEDKYLNMFFAAFKDEKERPLGMMVLIQDITEHVKLNNMRKEFVADVSHELKTPLTSIMGYAETLANSEYDKEMQEKFLNVITSETIRMSKLVKDLLTLSKFDNDKIKCIKQEFDLVELVRKCQENLQIEIDKKGLKAECLVTSTLPLVYADKEGIERVILNVLSNSIKYTRRKWRNKNIFRMCI